MAKDYLIFLQWPDLKWVLNNQPALLDGHRCVCFSPENLEYALRKDVRNVEYCESNLLSGDEGVRLNEYAETRALAIDYEFARIREEIFGIDNASGWDFLNFRLLLWRLTWFAMLAKHVRRVFEPGRTFHVVASKGPQDFLSYSGMPAKVFVSQLRKLGAKAEYLSIEHWAAGNQFTRYRLLVPDLAAVEQRFGRADALVHLPTCFHDKDVLRRQIGTRWRNVLDMPSPFYDVPVVETGEHRIELVPHPRDHPARRARKVADYENAYREHLTGQLRALLPEDALQEQVGHLVCGAGSQAIWFLGLLGISERFPDSRSPLVISNHDGGLSGPLWTWAQLSNREVHVLPHSATQNILLPPGRNVVAYADHRFRYPAVGMDRKEIPTRSVSIRITRHPRKDRPRQVKTIGLVFSLFSWGDVQAESLAELARFNQALRAFAAARGIRIHVRLKPDNRALLLCSGALRVPLDDLVGWVHKPLDDFAFECDLALFRGEATTAAAAFVLVGTPLVWVKSANGHRAWARFEEQIVPTGVAVTTESEVFQVLERVATDGTGALPSEWFCRAGCDAADADRPFFGPGSERQHQALLADAPT